MAFSGLQVIPCYFYLCNFSHQVKKSCRRFPTDSITSPIFGLTKGKYTDYINEYQLSQMDCRGVLSQPKSYQTTSQLCSKNTSLMQTLSPTATFYLAARTIPLADTQISSQYSIGKIKETSIAKTSSMCPVVLIQYPLLTNTDKWIQGHSQYCTSIELCE